MPCLDHQAFLLPQRKRWIGRHMVSFLGRGAGMGERSAAVGGTGAVAAKAAMGLALSHGGSDACGAVPRITSKLWK